MQHRKLKIRDSDPGDGKKVAKDLSQDFEDAAPQHEHESQQRNEGVSGRDPEFMTDEDMQSNAEMPPWMAALKSMMDSQTAEMKSAIGMTADRILNLENTVQISHKNIEVRFNQVELAAKENKEEVKKHFDSIEQRLNKPEQEHRAPGHDIQSSAPATSTWSAAAIVIGSWPWGKSPAERGEQAAPILGCLTGTDFLVNVPLKSSIVKVEFDGPHAAGQGVFKVRKWLSANPSVNKWAGLETDSENAARRRHLRLTAEKLTREHKVDAQPRYATSEIVIGDLPVLRMSSSGTIEQSDTWAAVASLAAIRWPPSHMPRRL